MEKKRESRVRRQYSKGFDKILPVQVKKEKNPFALKNPPCWVLFHGPTTRNSEGECVGSSLNCVRAGMGCSLGWVLAQRSKYFEKMHTVVTQLHLYGGLLLWMTLRTRRCTLSNYSMFILLGCHAGDWLDHFQVGCSFYTLGVQPFPDICTAL